MAANRKKYFSLNKKYIPWHKPKNLSGVCLNRFNYAGGDDTGSTWKRLARGHDVDEDVTQTGRRLRAIVHTHTTLKYVT